MLVLSGICSVTNMSQFNVIRENKIIAKISGFTVPHIEANLSAKSGL